MVLGALLPNYDPITQTISEIGRTGSPFEATFKVVNLSVAGFLILFAFGVYRSHTPLNVWFWAAYLVASQTPGMSAVQFQRQLGLSPLRDGLSNSPQAPLGHGAAQPRQDRWTAQEPC